MTRLTKQQQDYLVAQRKKPMEKLKPCPHCGKSIEIYVHPEWEEKIGLVYGALIEHRDCQVGMEVSVFSVHYKKTEEEARKALTEAWNTRYHSVDCDSAEKHLDKCLGYGGMGDDDEPCDQCKRCAKYESYESEATE